MSHELIIREAFRDEEFVRGLFALETPQEVQAALKTKSVELSIEEIVKIKDLLLKTTENGGVLSDEELQEVSGGFVILSASIIVSVVLAAGLFAASGVALGAGVAGAAWGTDAATGGQW